MDARKLASANIRRGDIRNRDHAYKAQHYAWSKISKVFPRRISPTDIDGSFELNSHFLYVEFKTVGRTLPSGQRLYFERKMGVLKLRGVVFVCEHDELETVDVSKDIRRLQIWYWDETLRGLVKVGPIACDDPVLEFWTEQWALHAEEKPNDFIRGLRETVGIYPQSDRKPYARHGGELLQPPFSITARPMQTWKSL